MMMRDDGDDDMEDSPGGLATDAKRASTTAAAVNGGGGSAKAWAAVASAPSITLWGHDCAPGRCAHIFIFCATGFPLRRPFHPPPPQTDPKQLNPIRCRADPGRRAVYFLSITLCLYPHLHCRADPGRRAIDFLSIASEIHRPVAKEQIMEKLKMVLEARLI